MQKIHVLLKKEELDAERLEGKVVVVLDVLFATSSIVTALAHGTTEVIPTLTGDAARAEADTRRESSYIIAGELNAITLPGFAHPTPLSLLEQSLSGRVLIYSTTNGTVAVNKSRGAAQVYAAALLNGQAIVDRIVQRHPRETVLLVCSGSADNFNLEDFYGAGYLVSLLRDAPGEREFTDAALAAALLHDCNSAEVCLWNARVGRMMLERGLEAELRFAAQKSKFGVVPQFVDGALRASD